MHIGHAVAAGRHIAGIGGQRKIPATNIDNFAVRVTHTANGQHHLRQVGVVGIAKACGRRYQHRRVRCVREFSPGNAGVIATRYAVQVRNRRIVGQRDGDDARQRARALAGLTRAAGQVVVVAVVDLDAVSTRRIRLVDGRVVGCAVVVQRIQKRRHVGPVGTRVQVDYKRFADAGAGAIDRADGGPGAAVKGVLDVAAFKVYRAHCGRSNTGHTQHITRHIDVGKAHRHTATTKIGAGGIEVSIRYGGAGAGQQLDRSRAGRLAAVLNRGRVGVGAGDCRRIIDSRHIDRAGVGTGLLANLVGVVVPYSERHRAGQRICGVVGVGVVRSVDVGDRPQDGLVVDKGVNTTEGQNTGAAVVTAADRAVTGDGQNIARLQVGRDRDGGMMDFGVIKIAEHQIGVDDKGGTVLGVASRAAAVDYRRVVDCRQVDRLGRRTGGCAGQIRIRIGQAVGQRACGLAGVVGRVFRSA